MNMAAVLAQVGGDTQRASALGDQCRRDGIGLCVRRVRRVSVAGLPKGGDMVDIDSK